jgi:2-polyprenyl-3-methyl-5-hydroxy-6-metoxy-1,4-benzoquinol methylase
VHGVDIDAATIDAAASALEHANVSFEAADAIAFLRSPRAERFDLIVCFEGLEHLPDLDAALAALRAHAEAGRAIVVSLPNGRLFGEDNPFHVTEFGYDEAVAAFAGFPGLVVLPQYLAEGSLIVPEAASGVDVSLSLQDRREPEYANHFLFCSNVDPEAVAAVHHGRLQVNAAPVFNRWSEDLKRGAQALWRENARLARARLGKGGSAAGSALARLAVREARADELERRCAAAEARVAELERQGLAALLEPAGPAGGAPLQVNEVPQPTLPAREAISGDPNSWEQRSRRAARHVIPWIEQTVPLAGCTVLEYGCGNGPVSAALAERCGRVIGLDIDGDGIAYGQERLRRAGIENVTLSLHALGEIEAAARRHTGEVDVFLLYAVLEHMTVAERLAVLRLAREVVRSDGAIVVCETPNRLIYFDHHTARMPFFHLLPDELALEYRRFSEREDFTEAIEAAAEGGREAELEAIVRWGRAVSFHEFELVFGNLSRHVIGSSYDPLLFAERQIHPDEVILARYLDRWRPDLAPAWSRYWLDVILSPRPVSRRPSFLRPWTADLAGSAHVEWTRQETLRLTGLDSTLRVSLPHPTRRLVLGTPAPGGRSARLRLRSPASEEILAARAAPVDGYAAFVTFDLPVAASELAVSAEEPCELMFVGYQD